MREKFRGHVGYQLIELLIVCLILAIISGIVIGKWWNQLEEYRLENAFRLFSSQLSEIRNHAVSINCPISVVISRSNRSFGFAGKSENVDQWIPLPEGVIFKKVPGKRVTFYPRGNAAPAGSFRLENSKGSIQVVVSVSGRIRWERTGWEQ